MKSINFRFLLASVACLTVLGSAAVMVHALQVRRQSAFLLEHARQSRSEQQFELALRDYQLYLQLAPKDVAAQAPSLVCCWPDCGQSPSAVIQLEAALRVPAGAGRRTASACRSGNWLGAFWRCPRAFASSIVHGSQRWQALGAAWRLPGCPRRLSVAPRCRSAEHSVRPAPPSRFGRCLKLTPRGANPTSALPRSSGCDSTVPRRPMIGWTSLSKRAPIVRLLACCVPAIFT